MSLVTLEGIKAAIPTLLPNVGTYLGRIVTVITANPAAAIIGIASIVLFIFLVKAIIGNNALIKRVEGNIQKSKNFIIESEARSIETQEILEQYRVSLEYSIGEIEILQRTSQLANSKLKEAAK